MRKTRPNPDGAPEREPLPLITLPLYLSGVAGLLLLLRSLEGVSYGEAVVFPVAVLTCCALWFSFRRGGLVFCAVFFGLAALYGRFAWDVRDQLFLQFSAIVERITRSTGSARVTELALLCSGAIAYLLFAMEYLLRSHETLYTLVTLLLAFSPALGFKAGFATLFLLCVFRIAYRVFQMAGRRERRSVLTAPVRLRLAGRVGLAMCCLLLLTFLAAAPLALLDSGVLYSPIYSAEAAVTEYLSRLRPVSLDTGGHMNRGNSVQTGDARLIVSMEAVPSEPLYLRGFSGGDYTGGDWTAADDRAILAGLADQLPYQPQTSGILEGLYRDMYFFLNENTAAETEPPFHMLEVRSLTGGGADYAPYYSQKFSDTLNGSRHYLFYEQRDMHVDWENSLYPRYTDWYHTLQELYQAAAREAYTAVPRERLPRLTALAEENPLSDVDEITAFILHTLHSRASYSLTPGWMPLGSDIVEEFLFERGKGYCQHFAAAAALLYRLYGIPARYVTGFVAEPSDFKVLRAEPKGYTDSEASVTCTAILTDRSAHAWVEIFLDGYGWTPVEVTPGSADSAAGENAFASFPGFDQLRFLQIGQLHGWNTPAQNGGQPSDRRTSGGLHLPKIPGVLLTVLSLCALFVPLWLLYRRRKWILRRDEGLDCRGAFSRMTELLRFGGLLPDSDGEAAVAERLRNLDPSVTAEESWRLRQSVERAAFGPSSSAPPEDELARSLYARAAETLYPRLSPPKKILFKWWKVFG